MFGFFDSPVTTSDRAVRQIVEPVRDPDSSAGMTTAPEEFGRDVDVSGELMGRGVHRDVSGFNFTVPAAPGVAHEDYNDGSAQALNDARWSTVGYYAGKPGHPGVASSQAITSTLGDHHILGGITQYAADRERPTAEDVKLSPTINNDGEYAYFAVAGSTFGSAASFADGLLA